MVAIGSAVRLDAEEIDMRHLWRLGFIPVGIVVALALALLATGAQATGGVRIATACSNETVNGAGFGKQLTLRFVLIGSVSCDKAQRLAGAYFNKMAAGHCGKLNNICGLQFPGGWVCSIFFSGESQQTGGAIAGCARTGAKIRLYKATRRTNTPGMFHLLEFLSPDRKVWCESYNGEISGPFAPFECGTTSGKFPMFSAYLSKHGKVTICFMTHLIQQPGQQPDTCFVSGTDQAPVLHVGQQNSTDGVLCNSEPNGITCTLTAGSGRGKGFFINGTSVMRIGPPPAPKVPIVPFWKWNNGHTQLTSLTFRHLPADAVIVISCVGRSCPAARWTANATDVSNLARRLKGRSLDVGTRLTITINVPGRRPEVALFVTRYRRAPSATLISR
jgi:hypothetical protein